MLFTSYGFILFVAVLFAAYYLIPKKLQWPLLLVASAAFVCFSDPRYLIFMGVTSLSAWLCALYMDKVAKESRAYIKEQGSGMTKEEKKAYKEKAKGKKTRMMVFCLLLNLLILSVTKYTAFVINNINAFLSAGKALTVPDILIPLGISFYTFRTLSYVIDVKRETAEAERNYFRFALFVSFFPQLVQGPISRYGKLSQTLFAEHSFDRGVFCSGLIRILWGYFKKVIIADRIISAVTALTSSPDTYYGGYVFIAMIFYAAELYCDFTGGIDITIGIGECLGIRIEENFDRPFFSKNIKEYWNRWHITMGSWFTDYIFYPLSVSPRMLRLSKWSREHLGNAVGKRVTVYISCFLVWLATGVWHGAAWNFIVWGLANFVVIMVSQELEPLYAKFHSRFGLKQKSGYKVFEIVRTFLLMSVIRMFDVYRDVPLTVRMTCSMFDVTHPAKITSADMLSLGISAKEYVLLAVCVTVVFLVSLYKARTGSDIREKIMKSDALTYSVISLLLISVLVFGAYGVGFDVRQFIYNQF